MTKRSGLLGLAILKVNWDVLGRDYLENFVPMVVECLRRSDTDAVSLPELQSQMEQHFGLRIPLNPLKALLQRAVRGGYAERRDGIIVRNPEKCEGERFSEVQESVHRLHDHIVGKLQLFAREYAQVEWTVEEAEDALMAFLTSDGEELLYASYEGRRVEGAGERDERAAARYIVGRFVSETQTAQPELFGELETLAKGSILASAVFVDDPARVSQKFRNTAVYFDTMFLIGVLGHAGDAVRAPCVELLELLRASGADMHCFHATMEEARGILEACAHRIATKALRDFSGDVLEHLIAKGMTSSDVMLAAARLPHAVEALGIRIMDWPDHSDRETVVDVQGFERALQNSIRYRKDAARIHDADCIAAIVRLRGGREANSLETSRALFVTPNVQLVDVTKEFFRGEGIRGNAPLCISDYQLGNILWLKNPGLASDLPRKRLLAAAVATTQPSDDLWKLYLAEIARLRERESVSEHEVALLRHSLTARRALMDLTRGDVQAFTEGTVQDVLEAAREHVRASLKEELRAEQEGRADDAKTAAERLAKLEEAQARIAEERDGWRGRLAAQFEEATARDDAIANRARGRARLAMVLPRSLAPVALLVGNWLTFPWDLPNFQSQWAIYLRTSLLLLMFMFSVYGSYVGTPLKGLLDAVQGRLARRFERRIRLTAGLSAERAPLRLEAAPPEGERRQAGLLPSPRSDGELV